jgi:hypothetical protein
MHAGFTKPGWGGVSHAWHWENHASMFIEHYMGACWFYKTSIVNDLLNLHPKTLR